MSERPTQAEIEDSKLLAEIQEIDPRAVRLPQGIKELVAKLREKDAATIVELQTINQTNAEVETLQNKRIKQLEYDIETWNIYAKEREATIAQLKEEVEHSAD